MTSSSYLLEDKSDVLVAEVFGDGVLSADFAGAESIGDLARGMWYGHASLMSWGYPPKNEPRSLWRYHEFDCQMNEGLLGCQAWAQVGVDFRRALAEDEVDPPLPVAPLLTSLATTVGQLGDWSFQGAQVVLPLRFQPKGYFLSGDAARWFDHSPTTAGVGIDLMVSFGHHSPPDAGDLFDNIIGGKVDARQVNDIEADPWPQSLWIRPNNVAEYTSANAQRWHIDFSEWSVWAAAWLITVLAERLVVDGGVDYPVAVSIRRDERG